MVGASAELFATLKPVLEQMGRNIVHCGEVGTGQIAKICNNLLLGISMIGVSEAMALGDALGIDTKVLAGIINSSTGRCWSSTPTTRGRASSKPHRHRVATPVALAPN
jgi:3-hydroxyisobutyrate dehydrogenase